MEVTITLTGPEFKLVKDALWEIVDDSHAVYSYEARGEAAGLLVEKFGEALPTYQQFLLGDGE
jgi:hypothetical protein